MKKPAIAPVRVCITLFPKLFFVMYHSCITAGGTVRKVLTGKESILSKTS
jgi:hypothetical protein